MADDSTLLNPGAGGDYMDEEGVTFGGAPTLRKRARVVIGGALAAALAAVQDVLPRLSDYGLTVRLAGNRAETVTQAFVAASTSSGTLLAANAAGRIGATIYNTSTSLLYISLDGTAASSSNAVMAISPSSYWEVPFGFSNAVIGVWVQANGGAFVAEYA